MPFGNGIPKPILHTSWGSSCSELLWSPLLYPFAACFPVVIKPAPSPEWTKMYSGSNSTIKLLRIINLILFILRTPKKLKLSSSTPSYHKCCHFWSRHMDLQFGVAWKLNFIDGWCFGLSTRYQNKAPLLLLSGVIVYLSGFDALIIFVRVPMYSTIGGVKIFQSCHTRKVGWDGWLVASETRKSLNHTVTPRILQLLYFCTSCRFWRM